MPLTTKQKQNLATIAAAAVSAERETGVPAELVAAQCVLESAWLTKFAAPNNAMGIKAAARHTAGPAVLTTENLGGRDQRVTARFAAFASLADCFRDHAWILKNVRAYRASWDAYQQNRSVEALARGIASAYATDPQYASKVLSVMNGADFRAAIAEARKAGDAL